MARYEIHRITYLDEELGFIETTRVQGPYDSLEEATSVAEALTRRSRNRWRYIVERVESAGADTDEQAER